MSKLLDAESGAVIFERVLVAESFWRRAVGLLGVSSMDHDQAILLRPCTSIHTCFMRIRLNVAFCAADGTVLKVITRLGPWRFKLGPRGSQFVLEWSEDSGQVVEVGRKVQLC